MPAHPRARPVAIPRAQSAIAVVRSVAARVGLVTSVAARVGLVALVAVVAGGMLAGLATPLAAQQVDPALLAQLRYRTVGPDGNRADAVVGEPGNPMVAYVGAASGGIWRTMDGGLTWRPVFDHEPVSSVNALAVAQSAPNQVWAGTGETFIIREAISIGDGVWKSTDRGNTWTHMGLDSTGRIGAMAVDPRNADVVYACALGNGFEPQQERGVYRTTDGGKTWQRVLFVDANTGCSDLALDPKDPQTLFAGMWQVSMKLWNLNSGGPGSGVFVSHDGGTTWARLHGGLPTHPVGKVSVALAASDPRRVYALIEDHDPTLYRSDDGGATWKVMNHDHRMADRAPYFTRVRVAPDDPDRVYFMSIEVQMSRDGGHTLAPDPPRAGGDNHEMWIDPLNPKRMMVANDGGATMSYNGGDTWQRISLPIAQIYHVYADNNVPYFVYGNKQDGESYRCPTNSLHFGGIRPTMCTSFGGGESGFGVVDTVSNAVAWSGSFDGVLQRFDLTTMHSRSVEVWPETFDGWTPKDSKYRWNWTFPIAISPHDPNRVYIGSQYVHMTTDGGQSYKTISPDLTRNDTTHELDSGGITIDNLDTFDGATLWSIAESPVVAGEIWTGSNDGLVQLTRDGGAHWQNVTPKDLPPWGKISIVEPSHFDSATAYIAVDRHMMADPAPYIYETHDFGETWKRIDAGIPHSVFSYVHVVREDPVRRGMLYAGTENGLYVTLDDGQSWFPFQQNLPHAPVYWIAIQPHFHDLLVATYGRGIWIMDDITPLRDLDAAALAATATLFTPRPAYRFLQREGAMVAPNETVVGQNPRYGADLNYFLKAGAGAGAGAGDAGGRAHIAITNAAGDTIRTFTGPARAGVNRAWWDLRYPAPDTVVVRSRPPGEPWVQLNREGTRPLGARHVISAGPLAPPGQYTVHVDVAGQSLTAPLTVLKDPHSRGTLADIQKQVDFRLRMNASVDTLVGMINQIEKLRSQLAELMEVGTPAAAGAQAKPGAQPRAGTTPPDVARAAKALDDATVAFEDQLLNIHLTGGLRDFHRNPERLFEKFGYLGQALLRGGLDDPPTDQEVQVYQMLLQQLHTKQAAFQQFLQQKVAPFNTMLEGRKLRGIIM